MSDVHVTRHGERWAVSEGDASDTPVSEFPTLVAAEVAARALARDSGGEVHVSDADPSGLGEQEDSDAGERSDPAGGPAKATRPAEHVRETQAGL